MVLEATSVPSGWDAQRGPRPSGFAATQTYVATGVVASDVIPPNGFRVRAAERETVLLSGLREATVVAEWIGPAPTEDTDCVLLLAVIGDVAELVANCLDQ